MRIAEIEVQGVGGLRDGRRSFGRRGEEPGRVVAVTGPRGAGKTRLLDVIAASKEAASPYGPVPSSADWARDGAAATTVARWWLDDVERGYAGVAEPIHDVRTTYVRDRLPRVEGDPGMRAVLGRYQHRTPAGKIDYLPIDRRIPRFPSRPANVELDQKQRRLSHDPTKYGVLPSFVADLFRHHRERAREVSELYAALTAGRRLIGIDASGALRFDTSTGDEVSLAELPRADELSFLVAASVTMIGLERSVVLFDAPELHQAPGEAARTVTELVAWSPSTQWLLATHDPELITMADVVVSVGGDA